MICLGFGIYDLEFSNSRLGIFWVGHLSSFGKETCHELFTALLTPAGDLDKLVLTGLARSGKIELIDFHGLALGAAHKALGNSELASSGFLLEVKTSFVNLSAGIRTV